jgi:hypothetical protein
MIRLRQIWRPLWLLVAILLAFGSFAGGDIAIVCTFLFLGWTPPFGALWYLDLYDIFLPFGPPEAVQIIGIAAVITVSYSFWFAFVPAVVRWSRAKPAGADS